MAGRLRRTTFRFLSGVAVAQVVVLLAAGSPQPALADPNPPTPVDEVLSLPAGVVCTFPVELHLTGRSKTIELPGGRLIVSAPGQAIVVTNLAEVDQSVSLDIPGASHVSTASNGEVLTVVTGRNLLFDPDAGFVLAIGRFQYQFDADGNLVEPLNRQGQLVDVCQLVG